MIVGKYDIEVYIRDGGRKFWIMNINGEGMEVEESDLERLIDKFYRENF